MCVCVCVSQVQTVTYPPYPPLPGWAQPSPLTRLILITLSTHVWVGATCRSGRGQAHGLSSVAGCLRTSCASFRCVCVCVCVCVYVGVGVGVFPLARSLSHACHRTQMSCDGLLMCVCVCVCLHITGVQA